MRHLDLFSGIGGFALAAMTVWGKDYECVGFCDIEPYAQELLKIRFPGVPIYDDIKKLTAADIFSVGPSANNNSHGRAGRNAEVKSTEAGEQTQYGAKGRIDLLTGGFPCQPFSMAGKRRGTEDDRHLWPEMLRVIKEVKPTWIIGENVAGILSMGGMMTLEWRVKQIMARKTSKPQEQTGLFGESSMTLNVSITPSKHLLFQLVPLAHRTGEIESGLLRTPDTRNGNRGRRSEINMKSRLDRKMSLNLDDQLNAMSQGLLPTPKVGAIDDTNDRSLKKGNLSDVVDRMINMPSARDWKGGGKKGRDCLDFKIEMNATKGQTGTKTGLKLQPGFVEWMMGYPPEWTDLNCRKLATELLGLKDLETVSVPKL